MIKHSEETNISLSSPSLRFGWGCFETMKLLPPNRIMFFEEHVERLLYGAKVCRLSRIPTYNEIQDRIYCFLSGRAFAAPQVLRLVLLEGEDVYISTEDINPDTSDMRSRTLYLSDRWRVHSFSLLNQFKSCNYLGRHLPFLEARENGHDDCLLLNERDEIAETGHANIFFVRDKKIYTPDLSSGALPGIIRQRLLDKFHIEQCTIKLPALLDGMYDMCFVSNCLLEIKQVSRIQITKTEHVSYVPIDEPILSAMLAAVV